MIRSRKLELFICIGILICAITFFSFADKVQQPEKKYSVVLTINEWQAVINSITTPDEFSNNQKKQISALITSNLKEVADTIKKK